MWIRVDLRRIRRKNSDQFVANEKVRRICRNSEFCDKLVAMPWRAISLQFCLKCHSNDVLAGGAGWFPAWVCDEKICGRKLVTNSSQISDEFVASAVPNYFARVCVSL